MTFQNAGEPEASIEYPTTRKSLSPQNVTVKTQPKYQWEIVWRNVLVLTYLHLAALYGLYLLATFQVKLATYFWGVFIGVHCALGITMGAHRLWSHKSYKAKLPLRIFLAYCNTIAFQNHIYEWVRDHRVHHKFTDTDADPHNSKRGFFFSHVGWLLVKKHEDVKIKGKSIDMSDLENDPVVMWQKRLYPVLMPLCSFVIPTVVPCYFWGEDPWISWYMCVTRYVYTLHVTWNVNSVAHIWGTKPYDRSISPTQNLLVAVTAWGEGWHNFHHAFPWDYKTAEFPLYEANFTTAIIDLFAKIGWAYDLKTVKPDMILHRVKRTGDGSHPASKGGITNGDVAKSEGEIWGWDDKDMTEKHKQMVEIINPRKTA